MSAYTLALFVHVSGAIGYFISAGTRVFVQGNLRRAQRVEQVRLITTLDGQLGAVFGISVLLLLTSGLYMAFTTWGIRTGWIDVGLISLILTAPLGAALMEPGRRAIERLAHQAPDGPIPAPLAQRIHDPVLQTSIHTLPVLLLGIVFLMTTKPTFQASLLVMGIALVLGVGGSLLFLGRGGQALATPAR